MLSWTMKTSNARQICIEKTYTYMHISSCGTPSWMSIIKIELQSLLVISILNVKFHLILCSKNKDITVAYKSLMAH